jgi:cellulose synthase/poly-beta-1,6-N-acetylglucosamine synthase-like glycosyltransferase
MVISVIYILVSICLVIYSINSLYLLILYHRSKEVNPDSQVIDEWPSVTVQLPVYNELNAIERLINSVARFDYPATHLQIQILDDSDDQTTALISGIVRMLREDGVNISHIHRETRSGYKAGALANGMKQVTGDFIAIFDADFLPPPDFLKKTIPYFSDPKVGCIQCRWGHTNRDFSLLTKLQAMAIDAHFMVEQTARSRNGLLLNFNGSGGVWRKACIEDSGGWQSGTLTEDFDLSYRAQIKGWSIAYLPNIVVPGELPAHIQAYKNQQFRWARGSIQTARKLLIPLLKSDIPFRKKIMGCLHLTHYMVHPLILLSLVLSLFFNYEMSIVVRWLPLLMLTMLISPLLYLTCPAPEAPEWKKRLILIPPLMLMSVGISLNNARAALSGLLIRNEGVFIRTPKYAFQSNVRNWKNSHYAIIRSNWVSWELMIALVVMVFLIQSILTKNINLIPWLIFYEFGYGLIALFTISQRSPRNEVIMENSTISG